MFDDELKTLCRKLKPVIGKKADSLWLAYASADRMDEKAQMSSIIQMLAARHLTPKVDDDTILLPPPTIKDAQGEFYLGKIVYGKTELFDLYLTRENLVRHIGCFGITGSGKTVTTQNLVLGLLKSNINFLVVDWKRAYASLRSVNLPGTDKIEVYSVGRISERPFHYNPLRPPAGVDIKTWIYTVGEVLERSHLSGPGAGDIFIEILDKKFGEMGFFDAGVVPEKYPNFFDVAHELKGMSAKGRRGLWQDTAERIVRSLTYGPGGKAFNARNPIDLAELLEKPVIIELDQELPRALRVFFSELILRWIHLHRLRQGESDTLKSVLVLEEIHNLFARGVIEKQATSGLETLARELRSFGQGLVAISQHPSLLPPWLLGNLNTLIIMALQHADDVESARKALFLERDEERYFSLLKTGEAIVRIQSRMSPTLVRVHRLGR